MATAQANIIRKNLLDDIRALLSFAAGGLVSGFIFAWLISRPNLRQFWYIKGDKFLIPRVTYYTAFGLIFVAGLAASFGIARLRHWLAAYLGSPTSLLLSVLIIGASPPALYFAIRRMEPQILEWEIIIGPLAFLALLSVALCVATRTMRLLPIVFVWHALFIVGGFALVYGAVQLIHPTIDRFDFIQWPILESVLALSFGSWMIWRERSHWKLTSGKIFGPEHRVAD